jgi:hypothetical protein
MWFCVGPNGDVTDDPIPFLDHAPVEIVVPDGQFADFGVQHGLCDGAIFQGKSAAGEVRAGKRKAIGISPMIDMAVQENVRHARKQAGAHELAERDPEIAGADCRCDHH